MRSGAILGAAPQDRIAAVEYLQPQENVVEVLLPNLLPLPARISPKQEESRANKVGHVVEI